MKKLLTLALVLLCTRAFSQSLNKRYDLYYYEDHRQFGRSIYPTGMWMRNDTLFIETGAIVNVVTVKPEKDSVTTANILLKPLREGKVMGIIVLPDTTAALISKWSHRPALVKKKVTK